MNKNSKATQCGGGPNVHKKRDLVLTPKMNRQSWVNLRKELARIHTPLEAPKSVSSYATSTVNNNM